jgi:tight adherence protein F
VFYWRRAVWQAAAISWWWKPPSFNPAAAKRKKPVEYSVLLPGDRDLPQPVAITSSQIADLSPWDTKGRWLPVYQVTMCLPGGEFI